MLENDNDLRSDACSQLERFVCVLYQSLTNLYNMGYCFFSTTTPSFTSTFASAVMQLQYCLRSWFYTTVKELRWFLYSNRSAEGENLPPTSGSLDLHIRRAHYTTMIWRKADENHPCLPAPAAFGWTFDAGLSHFSPVRCLNKPAPEAILHMINCGCKNGCEGRCSCRKNNILCYIDLFIDLFV